MGAPRRRRPALADTLEDLAVAYTRYSTEDQGSTPEQLAMATEIAADEGVTIVKTFSDEGVSRSIDERPGLQDAFAYLESHPEVRYLIVIELERLTAGVGQRQKVTSLCKRLGITIVTEDMGRIDPHDEDKMFEADQRAVSAKGEVLKVRRRVRRSLRAKVRSGSTISMRPCFGVRMKPLVLPSGEELPSGVAMLDAAGRKVRSGELELHPDEYPWLVQIFDWAYEGKSNDWIAQQLTDANVPTKSGRASWRGNTIGGILSNPFYKGEYTWGLQQTLRDENGKKYLELRAEGDPGRVTIPSPLGAIIDPEKWDALRLLRENKENVRRMTRRTWPAQVFDDLVYCGRCGHKMYGRCDNPKLEKIHWRYYCYSLRVGYEEIKEFGPKCTTAHSISLKDIIKALGGFGPAGATISARNSTGRIERAMDTARTRLQRAIEEAHAAYDRAADLAIAGRITEQKLDAQAVIRDEKIAAAEAELASMDSTPETEEIAVTDDLRDLFKSLSELLADESIDVSLRADAIRRAGITRLYVDKPHLTLHLSQ